ncbi:SH3 and multiple ankyrin repeat domains protein 2-like isoform X2 [Ruditapes philippinarum]|uniref:SH3 and multiple ankyrin repeat domains protein 2-like isoform X2 n=1 Tax=Ruditapes philippinarum TaxID=129788 RepID=UPI00295B1B90|nr:SH3 and multiple ankyrin repeat domains protein 2-like isoform X2 [Ruditapes philippinarum]
MTEFRGGTLQQDFRGDTIERMQHCGTLRDHENNTALLLREIDQDRRSTLKDARYGTTSTYMSEHQTGTVFIRVSVPELKVQKCLQFELDESVWEAKQRILTIFSKDLKDPLNYGIYMPPMNGRAGKFLEEERLLREYPLHGPIGFIEFKYKRRVYKVIHLNPRKLKQLHNKANFRQFIEHVKNGNLSKINKLTNKGLDPNFHDSSGETPLTYAVCLPKDKCREVIITLVSGGGHLDFRTRHGQTPMHKAILQGNQVAVQSLLDLGASTNYKDSRGLTPLYYSVLYGKNAACAELLLHERAVIGTQDEQGWFEIHQACKLGLVQHLEHLMFYGADLNVANASGNTALHVCAVNNNEQCTRVLLFRGANKHILNFNNQTAQQVAIIAGNVALAELIKNFDDSQVVPFREMPSFSSRRPRLSMYSSTMSLMSRSRSDPKLNITNTIDDSNITSPPSSMRSLPQHYQMYSDSGSYSASRGSDSPRSMSISSNSSGPGLARMAITPTYSMQSPQHEMHMRRDFSTRQRRYTYAGNLLGRTIDENFDDQLQQEEQLQFDSRENSVSDLQQRKLSVGNISQEDTEVKFILGSAVQTDERMIRTSPEIFIFPDSKELSKWKQNPVLQASGGSVLLQASEILGKVNLEPSLLDKTFICIEPFRPSRPGGLQLNLGDYVQVMSVSDTGFWEGMVNDKDGWFPAHHVQEVKLRQKAGSFGDLLAEESRENTLLYRNTLATLVRGDNSDYGPRTVVLQRASEGYGFVLRGAKSQLKPSGELDFRPTAEFPALQYLDSVDPGSVSDRAGLKGGDFILEINGENVVRASHDRVVHLIRSTGDTLAMKVVTVKPASRSQDWFVHQDKSLTMPNRKKKAPAPPQRDPRTSLSMSRSEGQAISDEMAAMDKLDEAIQSQKEAEEKKTASIRSRTAAKRVSCVDMDNIGIDGKLEKSKSRSTPDLLENESKLRKNIIYATPTVPDKKSSEQKNVYTVQVGNVPSSPTGVQMRPKGPPPPPPEETNSPKKKAPKPPKSESGDSSSSEVVTINTSKQSPYASVKVLTNKVDSPDSPYESSFRPGASAKLSEEPSAGSGHKSGHQRTPSAGAVLVKESDKQNVSFAEDKVLDHAAGFLKKHPNAKLLITAEGKEKLKKRNSSLYEPEPDYDSDSGEEKPNSPVRIRDPKKQSVTVISVGEKSTVAPPQTKRYTIHTSIPSEEKFSAQPQGFVIPPRPDGPAPVPPAPGSQSPKQRKSAAPAPPTQSSQVMTVKAEVNVQLLQRQQDIEESEAPPLPETPPPDFETTPSPRQIPSQEAAAAPPPPPPPPPPPAPSYDQIIKSKSVVKADYIAPVTVPTDAIAAAVAKRQERMQNEGIKMTEQKPKSSSPANIKDSNQAAILAAVAKRREKLEQQSESSVIDDIESRLQKTKKLQAARFQLAGAKSTKKETDTKTNNNANGISQNKLNFKVQSIVNKTGPATKEAATKEEFSFKVKPVNVTGLSEIKPKFTPKPLSKQTSVTNSAKVNTQESLKIKPTPLEKATPLGVVKSDSKINAENRTLENSEKVNNEKNVNGQSDYIALAEKRRQEWLQRKQKSSESKSSSPEKEKLQTKTIEIKPVNNKDKSPPVSAKPKLTKSGDQAYTEFQSPQGLVKVKAVTNMNGDIDKNGTTADLNNIPPPPPGFRDGGNIENTVVQLEIIPPPANFSSDSGTDMSQQHSPAFSPDTASLVSSLSTLSSLSGDGRGNGYDDVIAPPPPGFDDGDSSVIPPPPEFGNDNGKFKKTGKTYNDKPVDEWLCNDVLDWLDSLSMSQYKPSFQRNCIDGKKLVALSRNNYIDLGVTQVGHRMNLERSIKKAAIRQNNVSDNIVASERL